MRSKTNTSKLHKVLLVCIACDLVLARIWSNFNCINQPNTYINMYNPVVFTIAVNKSVWIIINLILQSMKSELLRTLLFPSVVNGFSWVKIRLKLSLFRNIFIKTKSFSLPLLCTLLTTQLGLAMSYIGWRWLWQGIIRSHQTFQSKKDITYNETATFYDQAGLDLRLVFCLQSSPRHGRLSSNKWPRPRYLRNYSSHIKVVRSLEKNIYYQNIGNVRPGHSRSPTRLVF